jgi:hypothetical protein
MSFADCACEFGTCLVKALNMPLFGGFAQFVNGALVHKVVEQNAFRHSLISRSPAIGLPQAQYIPIGILDQGY